MDVLGLGVGVSGGAGAWVLAVTGAIPGTTAIGLVTAVFSNIRNPGTARETGGFVVRIGSDSSDLTPNIATVIIQPSILQQCTINFNPTAVNTTGVMLVTIRLTNSLPVNGYVSLVFSDIKWVQ